MLKLFLLSYPVHSQIWLIFYRDDRQFIHIRKMKKKRRTLGVSAPCSFSCWIVLFPKLPKLKKLGAQNFSLLGDSYHSMSNIILELPSLFNVVCVQHKVHKHCAKAFSVNRIAVWLADCQAWRRQCG